MARATFWNGFFSGIGAGAAASVGAMMAWRAFGPGHNSRVLRIEKSIEIGAPVAKVFGAWADLESLPSRMSAIRHVTRSGDKFHWELAAAGQQFAWDAIVTQFIPLEAIGWKSFSGPKHTGRITFSPLGGDTLLHVQMNYAPPLGRASGFLAPIEDQLESYVEHALHEFKASLEKAGTQQQKATGTYGRTQSSRFGGMEPIEFTQPTEPGPFSKPDVLK
jgi:uncharacterized membrane protein